MRVAEIVPVLVVEIVPVRDAPLPVVEMMPVLVVEIVPALVVEIVPVFANVLAAIAITNIDAQIIIFRVFIALLLRSCMSGVRVGLKIRLVSLSSQADSLKYLISMLHVYKRCASSDEEGLEPAKA